MRVAVKKLELSKVGLTTTLLVEMRHMRDINHENLIRFIGLCPEEGNVAVLCEYSPRGCLRDLLQNDEITIDWPFRYCIMADIIEAMAYLHSTPVSCHGHLKSTNCVIDGRFVVKVTDFGLHELARQAERASGLIYVGIEAKTLLWTAPEILRGEGESASGNAPGLVLNGAVNASPGNVMMSMCLGTQKGDVYSFAIILQEIITRSAPFDDLNKHSRRKSQLTYEGICF